MKVFLCIVAVQFLSSVLAGNIHPCNWKEFPQTAILGGILQPSILGPGECQRKCEADPDCQSMEWELGTKCWFLNKTTDKAFKTAVTHWDCEVFPKDCADIRASGETTSGFYRIYPTHPGDFVNKFEINVYCDMDSEGNGWLVIQRRVDGDINFERTWKDYANGFGNVPKELWIGNEVLHILTSYRSYSLRIDMEDFYGEKRYADYRLFSVGSCDDKYRLTVSEYSGDAGDSLIIPMENSHDGMQFSTYDSDNDNSSGTNCALDFKGAWWYNNCLQSNLNGRYLGGTHATFGDGIEWTTWHGYYYSLKTTQMKIIPSEFLPWSTTKNMNVMHKIPK